MGKRAEKPEKNEKPSNPSANEPSSGPGEESQAAAGGSTEHKLPVVWSPKLNAGTGIEFWRPHDGQFVLGRTAGGGLRLFARTAGRLAGGRWLFVIFGFFRALAHVPDPPPGG